MKKYYKILKFKNCNEDCEELQMSKGGNNE